MEEKAKLNNLGTAWHDYNAEVGITLLITTQSTNQTYTENIVAKVAINEETFVHCCFCNSCRCKLLFLCWRKDCC